MLAEYIPSEQVNSDLGVVNAARVSLAKHHDEFISPNDERLIAYLCANNHWTPFAHARLYFDIKWLNWYEQLAFYAQANMAGFTSIQPGSSLSQTIIKGSLYAWVNALPCLPKMLRDYIGSVLYAHYPVSAKYLLKDLGICPFAYQHGGLDLSEDWIASQARAHPVYYKLLCATLRIKVPIFVARQIRTSQVGIAYSDLYVEGESFVYNEVSRRYVDDLPEFYRIDQWRVREGKNVKQGSTGLASEEEHGLILESQRDIYDAAKHTYIDYRDDGHLAPEQLRALLPQAMYTEFYMTGTLHRWAQFLALRLKPDVQEETRLMATMVRESLAKAFPEWAIYYALSACSQ